MARRTTRTMILISPSDERLQQEHAQGEREFSRVFLVLSLVLVLVLVVPNRPSVSWRFRAKLESRKNVRGRMEWNAASVVPIPRGNGLPNGGKKKQPPCVKTSLKGGR